jgi:hypothetical protein
MCSKTLTIFLISMFSCARLVIASAARLATPPLPLRACAAGAHSPVLEVARDGGLLMLCAARSFTRPAARHQQHDTQTNSSSTIRADQPTPAGKTTSADQEHYWLSSETATGCFTTSTQHGSAQCPNPHQLLSESMVKVTLCAARGAQHH